MKKFFWGLSLCCCFACAPRPDIQSGDILFQAGPGSGFERAVAAATSDGAQTGFTHMGLAERADKDIFVWEASADGGVRRVSLRRFLSEAAQTSKGPAVEVFRLKKDSRSAASAALERVRRLEGKSYDFLFLPDNDAYYCSELVQYAFSDGNGVSLFPSRPMSFSDRSTGKLLPYWREYFQKRAAAVPEGVAGTNPADMARSPLLRPVYRFF